VEGAGTYRAAANGDPTCLDLFHLLQMHLFNGQLTAIVQAGNNNGNLLFSASADGVKSRQISINIKTQ
jgi:beta-galactosidase